MQDEVNTKVVAIMIKGGKISAEVLKKALDKFVQEIEKAQKQMQQPKTYRGKQSIKHLMSQNAAIRFIAINDAYDSLTGDPQSDSFVIPFKNLINDSYCKDISMKIRSRRSFPKHRKLP